MRERIREAGLAGQVHPIYAEAHDLPYVQGFFAAIVGLDAYQYFGTADLYFEYLAPFLREGCEIGFVRPAFRWEVGPDTVPDYLPELYARGASMHSTRRSGGPTTGARPGSWG